MLDMKRDEIIGALGHTIAEDDLLPSEAHPSIDPSVILHCTLVYGVPLEVHPTHILAERFWCAAEKSGLPHATLNVKGVTTFDTEDGDCLVLLVESPQLTAAHEELSDLIKDYKSSFAYNPHVTMAYVKKGRGAKYEELWKKSAPFSLSRPSGAALFNLK
jgi:2'-5' RNA ligase